MGYYTGSVGKYHADGWLEYCTWTGSIIDLIDSETYRNFIITTPKLLVDWGAINGHPEFEYVAIPEYFGKYWIYAFGVL